MPASKFKPGQSGNPGGGPGRLRGRGVIEFLGKQTRDGQEVAEFFLRVFRGHEKGFSAKERAEAARWLADRYMGRAPDVALTGDLSAADNPLAELPNAELRALLRAVGGAPIEPYQKSDDPQKSDNPPREGHPTPAQPAQGLSLPSGAAQTASSYPGSPPSPRPPINDASGLPRAVEDVTSSAQKCPECGCRRAHNLDCSRRPKPQGG